MIYEGDDRIGHHRIFKFENQYGVSVRTRAPLLHMWSFYAEVAVLHFTGAIKKNKFGKDSEYFDLVYDTEITNDVEILDNEEEVINFLEKVKALKKRGEERDED